MVMRVDGEESEAFRAEQGLCQGCILFLQLFNTYARTSKNSLLKDEKLTYKSFSKSEKLTKIAKMLHIYSILLYG